MHVYETMVVWSSSTNGLIVYSPLSKKEAENCANGGIQYLSWTNLCNKHHFHCYWDTTLKISERNINTAEDYQKKASFLTASLCYWPNLSIDLAVELSKCYLLGRLLETNATKDCNWITFRSPQTETLMIFCLHKCFSLGLSWLCIFNWLTICKI